MRYQKRVRPAARRAAPPVKAAGHARAKSLTQEVYERLRAEIISCALEPGAQLFEAQLAARYGMSKTPVREALLTLRQDGLVRVLARRGYLVEPLTVSQVTALLELRGVVESGAAELAAARITAAQIADLETFAALRYSSADPESRLRFLAANRTFHLKVAEASRNSRLVSLLARCLDELERAFALGVRLYDIGDEVAHDHLDLVNALRERNGAEARRLVLAAVEHTNRNFLRGLTASSEGLSTAVEISR